MKFWESPQTQTDRQFAFGSVGILVRVCWRCLKGLIQALQHCGDVGAEQAARERAAVPHHFQQALRSVAEQGDVA
jgi:hypothetical protein